MLYHWKACGKHSSAPVGNKQTNHISKTKDQANHVAHDSVSSLACSPQTVHCGATPCLCAKMRVGISHPMHRCFCINLTESLGTDGWGLRPHPSWVGCWMGTVTASMSLPGKGSSLPLAELTRILVQLCAAEGLVYMTLQGQMQIPKCGCLQLPAPFGKQPGKSKTLKRSWY